MANKKTSQETLETNLTADDLFRYSKKTGSIFNSRAINKENLAYQILGYRRFVGVLSQSGTDAPEIIGTPYVNDVGLVNGDFSYLSRGRYLISKTGIGIGFKNQCGVLGIIDAVSAIAYYQLLRTDDDNITLTTYFNEYDSMASPPLMVISADRLINNNLIEIRFPAL